MAGASSARRRTTSARLDELKSRLLEADDLGSAASVLHWDQATYMPPRRRGGALQDVHWFAGSVGGQFQGYTPGNNLSAQFFAAPVRAHPGIPAGKARGEFGALHGSLRENVYQHRARFTPAELVERATGGPMSVEPYLDYLWGKYQPLYGTNLGELLIPT